MGYSFGSSRGGFSSPHYKAYTPPKKSSSHPDHSIVHNLLGDIRSTVVGLPMGFVQTAKGVEAAATGNLKPIEKIGSAMAHSYAHTYGPLFHGHYGEFLHRVGQHPLQPILDAISIATIPAGGLGVGIKAADTIAGALDAGRGVTALSRAASHFRPGVEGVTRKTLLDVPGAPAGHIHYSTNPVNRSLQKGLQKLGNKIGNYDTKLGTGAVSHSLESKFGQGGSIRDLTDFGRHERWLGRKRSEREVAAGTMWKREMVAARHMWGDDSLTAKDIANKIAPQVIKGARFHAFWVPESNLIKGKGVADGFAFLDRKGKYHAYPSDKTPEEFTRWITQFGNHLIAKSKKSALTKEMNGELHYAVIRRRALKDYLEEGAHTAGALHALYRTPTKVWKWAILATAPRYFVNNVVGNSLMLAMSANPLATSRGIYDVMREHYGTKVAQRSLSKVDKAVTNITGSNWVDRWFGAGLHGFSQDITRDLRLEQKFKNPVAIAAAKVGQQGLYGVTHHASDVIPRKIAINYLMRRMPAYKAALKESKARGFTGHKLHNAAANKAASDPAVRDYIVEATNNILGQYHHYTKSGRAVKSIIPFYGWDRAIMRHTAHMVTERPGEAAVTAQVGAYGTQKTKQALGKIPDFLEGSIPVGGKYAGGIMGFLIGGDHAGRKKILTTQGLNPYATVADVADAAGTLVHGNPRAGEAIGNQINPVLAGVIQHATGQSLVSGKKIQRHGGLLSDVAYQTAESTPYVRLAQTAISGRPHPHRNKTTGKIGSPLLYRGDERQQIGSLLGLPIKEMSPVEAATLYRRENNLKTPAKASTKKYHPATLSVGSDSAFHRAVRNATHKRRRSTRRKASLPRLSAHGGTAHVANRSYLKKINF